MVARQPHNYVHNPVVPGLLERVDVLDADGFQAYEASILSTIPGSVGDFGDLVLAFHESDPRVSTPTGTIQVPWRVEVDVPNAMQGPAEARWLELLYAAPASLSPVNIDLDLVDRPIELHAARDPDGLALDATIFAVAPGATSIYQHAAILSGDATLVLAAPTQKGTFRIQFGGVDFEDVPVAAGQTVRLPYTMPRRSMSVRVTNTGTAVANYSTRLVAGSH